MPMGLLWSPDGSKILVQAVPSAIYDIKRDQVSTHKIFPLIFGTSPILPNGNGFLALMDIEPKGLGNLAWVDWEGKPTRIKHGENLSSRATRKTP